MIGIDLANYDPYTIVLTGVPKTKGEILITYELDTNDTTEFKTVWDFIEWREDTVGIEPFIVDELGFTTLAEYSEYIADKPDNVEDLLMTVYDGFYAEDFYTE